MRALKMRSVVDGLQKLTTTNWEQSLKLILLQLHEKLPKNSMLTILWSLSIWSKLERWKSHKWMPHELTENKKIVVLKSCLLFILCNNNPFSYWIVTRNEEWILYDNERQSAQWLDQENPKHLPKPNVHQKKVKSLFCYQSQVCYLSDPLVFWIAEKPLHLRSMLSKLMRCTENCNASSRHWSTWAQFFSTMPDHMLHNQCFKSWMNWAKKFCLIRHIHLTSHKPTTTSSRILTTFCREMLPQPAGGRKCFPGACPIPKHGFLHYMNKQTYFSLAKMC